MGNGRQEDISRDGNDNGVDFVCVFEIRRRKLGAESSDGQEIPL